MIVEAMAFQKQMNQMPHFQTELKQKGSSERKVMVVKYKLVEVGD